MLLEVLQKTTVNLLLTSGEQVRQYVERHEKYRLRSVFIHVSLEWSVLRSQNFYSEV